MAQKTAAEILTEITTLLADNTSGAISAEDVRSVLTDIKDSFVNLSDAGITTAEAAYLAGVTSAIQTQIDSKIANLSEDTTPELGGNLDGTGFTVTADDFIGDLNGAVRFTAKAIGSSIDKGEAVYLSGISGNTPEAQLAQANSSSTMPAFGIAIEDIALNNTGKIATFGSVKGLDVSNFGESGITFSLGDTLYISASEAGKLTNVAPTGQSNLIQNIGKIERATPTTNISIKVGGAGRSNATPNLNEGNVFIGNSNNQSAARALVTSDISDITATSTELNYVDGVTSNIQTQIDSKISDVVDDTTPQLGGNLDAQSNNISGVAELTATNYISGTQTLTSAGGGALFNLRSGNYANITLTEDTELEFTNDNGQTAILEVTQDTTTRALTFLAVQWEGGSAPTITAASGAKDVFRFTCINDSIYGEVIGQNMG